MTSAFLNNALLPAAVFFLMFITGTGMQLRQFHAVRAFRQALVICVATQLVLLPMLAMLLIVAARPDTFIALGLMILAISPSGALSTVYVYIGRGNVALSAVLTSIGAFAYVLAFPVLAQVAGLLLSAGSLELSLPISRMVTQFLAFLLVPVCLGILLAWRCPALVHNSRRLLDIVAAGLLIVVVASSTLIGWQAMLSSLFEILVLSAVFTAVALAGGYATTSRARSQDRGACAVECAVRNIPVAILLAQESFDGEAVIGFFVGFFLVNAAMITSFSVVVHRGNRPVLD